MIPLAPLLMTKSWKWHLLSLSLSLSLSLFLSYFLNCCLSLSLLNHVCHFLSSFLYSRIVFSWILSVYLYVLKELLPRRQRQRDRKRERERERICLIRMKMNCRPEIKNFQITCGLLACCIFSKFESRGLPMWHRRLILLLNLMISHPKLHWQIFSRFLCQF